MFKLKADERLLIEIGINHYKLVGPGLVWLMPWQKPLVRFSIGTQAFSLSLNEVHTTENVPVNLTLQVLYQVDLALLTENLLDKVPGLNDGGWLNILRWRTEYILRQVVADCSWREVGQSSLQQRLEQQLAQKLADYLRHVGLQLISVCLLKVELPETLQWTLIQTERDSIAPRGRALVLKEYFDIFGPDVAQAMPYIVQWELLNTLHKNDQTQLILTSSALSPEKRLSTSDLSEPAFQIQLPLSSATKGAIS